MKKKLQILFLFTLSIFSIKSEAQDDDKRIAVSLHTGLGIMQGDGQTGTPGFTGGLGLKYSLANNFSIRAQILAGSMSAVALQDSSAGRIYSSTTTFYEGNIQGLLNIVNFKKRNTGRNYAHLYIGLGLGYTFANIYFPVFKPGNEPNTVTALVIPFIIGMRFYINPLLDFGVEYIIKETFTDHLEGCDPNTINNVSNDYYHTPNVYINFNLGRNKTSRNLEWTEQTEKLNEDLIRMNKETQSKIEAMQISFENKISEVQRKSDSIIHALKSEYQKDSDSDGVSNFFDKEPNTPAGKIVDGSGRTLDLDRMHISEYLKSHSIVSNTNSNNYTPIQKTTEQVAVKNDEIKNIQFEINSAIILPDYFSFLDSYVKVLNENSSKTMVLVGHSDDTGSEAYNLLLSQKRAETVKSYFVSKGVNSKRITTKGYGKSKPLVSNETEDGKAKNRRVDITID